MDWKNFHKEQKPLIEQKIKEFIDELEEDNILKGHKSENKYLTQLSHINSTNPRT